MLYGLDKMDTLLVPTLINAAGFVLNAVFSLLFFRFSAGAKRATFVRQSAAVGAVLLLGLVVLVAVGSEPVGYMADGMTVLMLFAPLAAAGHVIRTRSTHGMPCMPLVFVFTQSIAWMLFGINVCNVCVSAACGAGLTRAYARARRRTVALPNAFGIVFGAMQLTLYAWARSAQVDTAAVGAAYAMANTVELDALVAAKPNDSFQGDNMEAARRHGSSALKVTDSEEVL